MKIPEIEFLFSIPSGSSFCSFSIRFKMSKVYTREQFCLDDHRMCNDLSLWCGRLLCNRPSEGETLSKFALDSYPPSNDFVTEEFYLKLFQVSKDTNTSEYINVSGWFKIISDIVNEELKSQMDTFQKFCPWVTLFSDVGLSEGSQEDLSEHGQIPFLNMSQMRGGNLHLEIKIYYALRRFLKKWFQDHSSICESVLITVVQIFCQAEMKYRSYTLWNITYAVLSSLNGKQEKELNGARKNYRDTKPMTEEKRLCSLTYQILSNNFNERGIRAGSNVEDDDPEMEQIGTNTLLVFIGINSLKLGQLIEMMKDLQKSSPGYNPATGFCVDKIFIEALLYANLARGTTLIKTIEEMIYSVYFTYNKTATPTEPEIE